MSKDFEWVTLDLFGGTEKGPKPTTGPATKRITKETLKNYIKMKLATNEKWALRALELIYSKQTENEQAVGTTTEHNNVGFSGTDAEFLSSLARQYQVKGRLSPGQMVWVHKKMVKYWRQVLQLSDRKKLENMINV